MLQLDSCLEIAKSAALLAGKYIKDRHNQDLEILLNEGRDIKLQIDVDAEKIIKDHLIAKSSFPILAEESGASNELNEFYWVVDPLDGTSNYSRDFPMCCISIALIYENRPIFGMIHVPASNEIFWGSKEIGAYHLKGDSLSDMKKISASQEKKDSLRIVSSRSHPSGGLKILLEKLEKFELVSAGSSLKFCLIANGKADIYPRFGPTSEWDTAAGQAIVEFAGGSLITIDKKPLKYNLSLIHI